MNQINEKLNKIAKAIDETVELPETNLITDSLDAITKALGGTPNDSNLIVDKLDDIAGVAEPKPTGNIELTENGENINVAPYATATVNVSGGGGGIDNPILTLSIDASEVISDLGTIEYLIITENNILKNKSGVMVSGGETYEFNILVPAWDNGDDPDVFVWSNNGQNGGLAGTSKVITASNEINCMANIDQEHYSMYIMVTDPTQPASATLTITNS